MTRAHPVTMIVDGNNLGMRSFHAAKNSAMSADGEHTGTLVLFLNTLGMHVRAEHPTRLVICWDSAGTTWREKLYPAYKAHRRALAAERPPEHIESFRLVKGFLDLAGVPCWSRPGREADDLIAGAWRRHHLTDNVIILSSDKDLLQLLDARTTQIRFGSYNAETDRWDRARFVAAYGFTPTQLPLVMALQGDASDGVPGIHGIGPKKAVKMLAAADWDLQRALAGRREDYAIVTTSHTLVDLGAAPVEVDEVPVFLPTRRGTERFGDLLAFCERYRLRTVRARLVSDELWY